MNSSQDAIIGRGRSVLVVDDDPVQARLVRAQLEAEGFDVESALGAREALERLAQRKPDVIVSDVLMDEIDGFSLCRMLRSRAELADTPILLVSAYFNEGADRTLARQVGASDLVERTPSMRPCIDLIERSLTDRTTRRRPHDEPVSDALHVNRVSHQLARQRREALRAEARYQALFELANDAISFLSPDGIVLDVNHRWEEITGLSREQMIGRHVRDFSAPGHEAANVDAYVQAAKQTAYRAAPVAIAGMGGKIVYLEFTTTRMDVGDGATVMAIGRDVTELVHSHQKLAASEHKFRSLLANIPEVLWSTNARLELSFVSPNIVKLSGFSALELENQERGALVARVHPEDSERVMSALRAVVRHGAALDIEFRWLHADGSWRWFHSRGLVARDDKGAPCVDGVLSDITERKLLEEQVTQAQRAEALGLLTAGIAHDFKNILAVVQANGEYLLERLPSGDLHDAIADTCTAVASGITLTHRLMSVSRKDPVELGSVDLNEIVDNVGHILARTLGRAVELVVRKQEGLSTVRADAGQLEQVLMNLAVNARDAMPSGGTVTIATDEVDVTGQSTDRALPPPGRYVRLTVSDTGIGMSADVLDQIFQPFFTTKEKGRGTGLGLSTSSGIVRNHGGHCCVSSAIGRGSKFEVYLPRERQSARPARDAGDVARRTSRSIPAARRAMLVRDEIYDELTKAVQSRTSELDRVNAELAALTQSVSRDLNAPIRAIEGFAEAAIVDGGAALDRDVKRHLERVKSAASRMRDFVHSFVELAHVSRTPLQRELLDVSALARRIARRLARSDATRKVRFAIADGLTAHADTALASILLENLILNAWKFTAPKPDATIEVGASRGELFVRDDGVGFDSGEADRVFLPFHQIAGGSEVGPAGVGLAMVRRIVRRHGGNIRVEATPGLGSAFYFTLDA